MQRVTRKAGEPSSENRQKKGQHLFPECHLLSCDVLNTGTVFRPVGVRDPLEPVGTESRWHLELIFFSFNKM